MGLLLLSVNLNGLIQMDILNGSKAGIGGEGITCYRIAVNGKLPGIDQRRSQALVCHSSQDGVVNFLNTGLISSRVICFTRNTNELNPAWRSLTDTKSVANTTTFETGV